MSFTRIFNFILHENIHASQHYLRNNYCHTCHAQIGARAKKWTKQGGDEASEGTPDMFALARELLLRRLDLVRSSSISTSANQIREFGCSPTL